MIRVTGALELDVDTWEYQMARGTMSRQNALLQYFATFSKVTAERFQLLDVVLLISQAIVTTGSNFNKVTW